MQAAPPCSDEQLVILDFVMLTFNRYLQYIAPPSHPLPEQLQFSKEQEVIVRFAFVHSIQSAPPRLDSLFESFHSHHSNLWLLASKESSLPSFTLWVSFPMCSTAAFGKDRVWWRKEALKAEREVDGLLREKEGIELALVFVDEEREEEEMVEVKGLSECEESDGRDEWDWREEMFEKRVGEGEVEIKGEGEEKKDDEDEDKKDEGEQERDGDGEGEGEEREERERGMGDGEGGRDWGVGM
ncbi:uncharacterized protein MONOS_16892 [Monocercomonoides exilis]|uniref:uncharacterized protein n=1 Tax=Monocercomonoides exilis TaxID=2049356 RepID=UPI00355A6767|nr:hypothetical protein MONOS_16892 [Monocercomonoides exilis]